MAKTVIGYFRTYEESQKLVNALLEQNYQPEMINIVYREKPAAESEDEPFDTTLEVGGPVAEFKEAFFDAELTEEDAHYYQSELDKGTALIAVFVPTNTRKGRAWEAEIADQISDSMRRHRAYDREIRTIYSNRGMTTYPQNRYTDPAGLINPRDRIYRSASPLNEERSTTVGIDNPEDADVVNIERSGGRELVSGTNLVADFAAAEAEQLLQKAREQSKE